MPDAYKSMYNGWTCVNIEDILINISDSEKPKFVRVTGSNRSAEANIAGITPAVLSFKGKCEDSPP